MEESNSLPSRGRPKLVGPRVKGRRYPYSILYVSKETGEQLKKDREKNGFRSINDYVDFLLKDRHQYDEIASQMTDSSFFNTTEIKLIPLSDSHQFKMSQRVDYFKNSSLASHYKKYREDMSDKCVKRILQFLEEKFKASDCTAVDVGCGSGQATKTFAPYLNEIIGVDSSEAQLSEVSDEEMPKNVTFRYGRAEALPVDDKSVHLVTATLAAHWFNYPAFIEEVDRVLVPGGVLALTGTDRPIHVFGDNPEVEEIIQELRDAANENLKDKDLSKGWHSFYKTVELPYKCFIRDHSVEVEKTTTLSNFINTFRTFTFVAKFLTEEPEKAETALQRFHDRLIKSLKITTSPEDAVITYKKRYIVLLSRKPEN